MGKLLLLIGASGSGKSFLARTLVDAGRAEVLPSVMTRPTRDSDRLDEIIQVNHVEFRRLVAADKLLEHEEFNGHNYGTTMRSVMDIKHLPDGAMVVKPIKPEGALKVATFCQDFGVPCKIMWVHVPIAMCGQRLVDRDGDAESLDRRALVPGEVTECHHTIVTADKQWIPTGIMPGDISANDLMEMDY